MPSVVITYHTLPEIQWESWAGELIGSDSPLAVFRIDLSQFSERLSDFRKHLQPDELARAQRYHQQKDQHRFIIVRGLLRILLGQQTNLQPAEIEFSVGHTKKPELKGFLNLHYNVSHSGNWALIALADRAVGIDIEQINPQFSIQDIVAHSFNQQEQQYLQQSADPRLFFYQLWTRKEALLKATAKGITDDFYRLPSWDGKHSVDSHLIGSTDHWTVRSFDVADRSPAAVAYQTKSTVQTIRFYTVDSGL